MIGLVMAGGRGTRMSLPEEKLLLKYKKPIIFHVFQALNDSGCFSKIVCITSPHSPKTRKAIIENNLEYLDTPGLGYVEDLNSVILNLKEPALVVSGDLPFLDCEVIRKIVSLYNEKTSWMSILVHKDFLESMKVSTNFSTKFRGRDCCFTGISLINSNHIKNLDKVNETYKIIDDKRIAFNLNTKKDYDLLCAS